MRTTSLKVLVMSTYPVAFPKDGGQLRAAAETAELRKSGFQVSNLVVATENWPASERGPSGYFRDATKLSELGYPWVCWDLALGREIYEDSSFRNTVADSLKTTKPNIIVLIQPWLWPICNELLPGIPIVYSSQNVEHRLKQVNLQITKADNSEVEKWTREVMELEIQVLGGAFRSIAVSDSDANWMRTYSTQPVLVAPNGTHRRSSQAADRRNWLRHFGGRKIATFVASGHPPNAIGFWDMLGPNLAFLEPEKAIVALGSVGPSLQAHPKYVKHRAVNNARLVAGGFQPDRAVSAVLDISHAAILPITFGEGSNLKTAEALLSPRLIVGTSRAFRGFESFRDLPGVAIADEPEVFQQTVKAALEGSQLSFDRPEAEALLWSNTLKPLVTAVREAVA
jgi:hypothetical protein